MSVVLAFAVAPVVPMPPAVPSATQYATQTDLDSYYTAAYWELVRHAEWKKPALSVATPEDLVQDAWRDLTERIAAGEQIPVAALPAFYRQTIAGDAKDTHKNRHGMLSHAIGDAHETGDAFTREFERAGSKHTSAVEFEDDEPTEAITEYVRLPEDAPGKYRQSAPVDAYHGEVETPEIVAERNRFIEDVIQVAVARGTRPAPWDLLGNAGHEKIKEIAQKHGVPVHTLTREHLKLLEAFKARGIEPEDIKTYRKYLPENLPRRAKPAPTFKPRNSCPGCAAYEITGQYSQPQHDRACPLAFTSETPMPLTFKKMGKGFHHSQACKQDSAWIVTSSSQRLTYSGSGALPCNVSCSNVLGGCGAWVDISRASLRAHGLPMPTEALLMAQAA